MTIRFYGRSNEQYKWMSNFHVAIFTLQGHQWASIEHWYQAMKALDPDVQAMVRSAGTPGEAKRLGRVIACRPDWEDIVGTPALHTLLQDDKGPLVHLVKDHFMFTGLIAKFTQRKELREALLLTASEELVEDSPTDLYWGIGKNGTGLNKLGRMLQLVRSQLINHGPLEVPEVSG